MDLVGQGPVENTRAVRLPTYLVITPARNEERLLERTIHAMLAQTVRPIKWIIVNDGSTDGTAALIDRYAAGHDWIERFDMPAHGHRSFAAKARCFNAAWTSASGLGYDVVANLDADVTFEPDYLEFLLCKFVEHPDLGVAGTPFVQEGRYDSSRDGFEGETHVPGGCQLFRATCLDDIRGYVPNRAGGVDWIAVTTARMRGWKTRSFRERRFVHHRALGTADRGPLAAFYAYGQKDYFLGGSPLWEICRIAYRMGKRPVVLGGLALGLGFVWAAIRRVERPVSADLMRFHRLEQMAKLRAIVGALLRLKKLDTFRPHAYRSHVEMSVIPAVIELLCSVY